LIINDNKKRENGFKEDFQAGNYIWFLLNLMKVHVSLSPAY